jgi:DNA-binding response OmpR family regulator
VYPGENNVIKNLFRRNDTTETHTVFILDDDLAVSKFIVKLLEEQGYTVHAVSTGAEGFTLLNEIDLPDALIIDFTLPDMTGQQFIESLRVRVGRTALPPILLLTASEEGESVANQLQVSDYLPKPFNNEKLLSHIKGMLEKSASA